jgi:hypothetical protein
MCLRPRHLFLALSVVLVTVASAAPASAALIELELHHPIGPIDGVFGDGQAIGHTHQFFDPLVFGLGDTLVVNIHFDQRLQVFDFQEPTDEVFSLGLFTVDGSPGFSGTWISSLEALGGRGGIWSGPITLPWQGGGSGFGWGGQGINLTDHQGSFTGLRWTTQLTSANEGVPMTLDSFGGVTMVADGIRTLPIPEPGVLSLLGIGLGLFGWNYRPVARAARRAKPQLNSAR